MADGASSSAFPRWRYIDDSGNVQGPFSTAEMQSWLEASYLNGESRVSDNLQADKAKFWKIKDHPSGSPFKLKDQPSKGIEDDEAMTIPEEEWNYKDEEGSVQGPFSDSNMQNWYTAGYFTPETLICRASQANDESNFKPIKEVAPEFLPDSIRIPMLKEKKTREEKARQLYYYVDDEGKEKGPFSEQQMRSWYKKGYFHEDTRVRLSDEKETYPLGTKQCNFKYLPRSEPVKSLSSQFSHGVQDEGVKMTNASEVQGSFKSNPEAAPWLQNFGRDAGTVSMLQNYKVPPTTVGGRPSPGLAFGDETSKWLYLDDNNKEQGPWTTDQMRKWYQRGMLSSQVRIRLVGEPNVLFVPIAHRPAAFKYPPGAIMDVPAPPSARQIRPAIPPLTNSVAGPQKGEVALAMKDRLDAVSALSQTLDKIDNRQPNAPWNIATLGNQYTQGHLNPYQKVQTNPVNPYTAIASFNKRSGRFSYAGNQTHYQRQGLPENREERMMAHYFDHDSWQEQKNAAIAAARAKRRKKF